MKLMRPSIFYFHDDGVTPNNKLPLLIYKNIFENNLGDYSDYFEEKFKQNNWTNNWRDIILSEDHYHSTTHEVLGIGKGSVGLQIGGRQGENLIVEQGDVLIVPAGVAHRSLDQNANYEVIGGYPEGHSWDMIYCEPKKYLEAKNSIERLAIPFTDPIFGKEGPLTKLWL